MKDVSAPSTWIGTNRMRYSHLWQIHTHTRSPNFFPIGRGGRKGDMVLLIHRKGRWDPNWSPRPPHASASTIHSFSWNGRNRTRFSVSAIRSEATPSPAPQHNQTHKSIPGTERARMYAQKHTMPTLIHLRHPLRGGGSPRKKYYPPRLLLGHQINDLLREPLPPMPAVAVSLVRLYRQTCIEHQHAPVRPRGKQSAIVGRRLEGWIVLGERYKHVLERGRRSRGWAHGEAEAVRLVHPMIRVLAQNDRFDGVKGGMLGPFGLGVSPVYENALTTLFLPFFDTKYH